jgi:DNA helicase-2/ATP-dependent DNA helicase PcrA
MPFTPSPEQEAIFKAVRDTKANIAINALAGTGKTTTLVELAKLLPQNASKIFCAFNRDIVGELEKRLAGTGVRTQTFHSIGFAALKKHLGVQQMTPEGGKYRSIVVAWADNSIELQTAISEMVKDSEEREKLAKDMRKEAINMAVDLLNLLRYKLAEWEDLNTLQAIIWEYRLDDGILFDPGITAVILQAVPTFMAVAESQVKNLIIDFTDMIYWPVRWDVRLYQFLYVMVDEAQDLSPMQRRLIQKALWERGGRIFVVGDPNQAIYAFAGADSDSFDLTVDTFHCTEYPLTITRRCHAVVTGHAANLVPAFRCPEDKPRGKVVWLGEERMVGVAEPGDMILSRVKAPLVAAVLEFIAANKPATILGSEIGKALVAMVEKLENRKDWDFANILDVLATYEEEQVERYMKKNDEGMAEGIKDSCAALRTIIEYAKASDVDALKYHIETLFSDDKNGGSKIVLSTIHKSKGLEADRVFILKPEKLPLLFMGQTPETARQEHNLDYVARTRAKSTLVYLTNPKYLENNVMPPYVQTDFEEPVGAFIPKSEAYKLAIEQTLAFPPDETATPTEKPSDPPKPEIEIKPVVPSRRLNDLIEQLNVSEIDRLIALLTAAKEQKLQEA